jgi:predicted TIM-barrel fold metal-dependent hydrolase
MSDTGIASLFHADRKPNQPRQYGRIYKPDEAWHAKAAPEPALSQELPIVDAHHHLWDMPGYRYLLHDLLADLGTGHNVVATVFAECHSMYRARGPAEMRPVGEVEFCAGVAAMSDSGRYGPTRICAGIVGFADLTLGDRVTPVLEAEIAAGGGRFRGIRHGAAWDADPIIGNSPVSGGPGLYQRSDFRAGLARLAALGLSFDAWVFHTQIGDVAALARAFPAANIVLCHMGSPLGYGPYAGRREEVFAAWKAAITDLAQCPNVTVKLGGLTMRRATFDYLKLPAPPTSEELAGYWRPYVSTCLDLFGAERCLAESNFPVEKMGIGYGALWNALKRLAAGASADEKRAIFSGTAQRVYRLDLLS